MRPIGIVSRVSTLRAQIAFLGSGMCNRVIAFSSGVLLVGFRRGIGAQIPNLWQLSSLPLVQFIDKSVASAARCGSPLLIIVLWPWSETGAVLVLVCWCQGGCADCSDGLQGRGWRDWNEDEQCPRTGRHDGG
jgi:hypothetical protein